MVEEMIKFRKMLDDRGIEWVDKSDPESQLYRIDRTHFWYRNYHYSVINGYGTYGGNLYPNNGNGGLLEVMSNAINDGEPEGWLTAEDVMKLVIEEVKSC